MCEEHTEVSISELLDLECDWHEYTEFSQDDVQRVIDALVRWREITKGQLWTEVVNQLYHDFNFVSRRMERLQQQLRPASLPDAKTLEKLQRYEAHISRQFYKSLHELQRLQVARLNSRPTAPLAVDIDIDSAA